MISFGFPIRLKNIDIDQLTDASPALPSRTGFIQRSGLANLPSLVIKGYIYKLPNPDIRWWLGPDTRYI